MYVYKKQSRRRCVCRIGPMAAGSGDGMQAMRAGVGKLTECYKAPRAPGDAEERWVVEERRNRRERTASKSAANVEQDAITNPVVRGCCYGGGG